jgi:hypothetical protein
LLHEETLSRSESPKNITFNKERKKMIVFLTAGTKILRWEKPTSNRSNLKIH